MQNPGVVRALLHAGADVEAETADGTTPLELVIRQTTVEILDLLLGAGVDWHKGVRGRPAADVARELLVAWDAYAADRAAELPRELAATIHEGRAAIVQRLEALPHEARPPGERWGE